MIKRQRRFVAKALLRLAAYMMKPNKKVMFVLWFHNKINPDGDEAGVRTQIIDRYPRR